MTDSPLSTMSFHMPGSPARPDAEQDLQMDPRLQRLVAHWRSGNTIEATASSGANEVAVVAKVTSRSAWEELSEVRAPKAIGPWDADTRTTIVTGRLPVQRIEAVRQMSFVRSLKAAQPLQPALLAGIPETNAAPAGLPTGTLSDGGRGVVVGIIDYGCDIAHRNFQTMNGQSRIEKLWVQDAIRRPGQSVAYGREFDTAAINAALTQPDPYTALGYVIPQNTPLRQGTHGTHVMDIAAGNGNGSGVPGYAPNASLIFVDISHHDIPFIGSDVVGSQFGDSVVLLEAVQYIFDQAGDRPCVINISLGTNGGPHDGTTLVEEGIDRLIAEKPGRAVTIAASNSFDDGIHAAGQVAQDGTHDLTWRVPFIDQSHNELEVWYPGDDRFSMELLAPDGTSVGTLPPGTNGEVIGPDGAPMIFASNRLGDPNNDDNMIGVFLETTAPFGVWTVRLTGLQVTDGSFHAWIERDNVQPSSFEPPLDNTHTIGSISCGRRSFVVGSYDAHKPNLPISWFSSAGPTRDGREKPELSAPGHTEAAMSRTTDGVVMKRGTSMAAPAVAGVIALMMAEALHLGIELTEESIRQIFADTARRGPPGGNSWDDRFGNGRVDAAACLEAVRARAMTS